MPGARGAEPVVARSDVVASPSATSKKSDVDCENGKGRKRDGKPARERAREGGRKKEARGKSDDGGKATL